MKHRRFSFLTTVFAMLILVVLVGLVGFWLEETLDLPNWVNPLLAMFMLVCATEFAARFGPKEFATPFSQLRRESRRDQVVVIVALIVFAVIALPVGQGVFSKSGLAQFGFLFLGAIAYWAICFFGGTSKLRAEVKPKWFASQSSSEQGKEGKS